MKYLVNLDLNKNQLLNAVLQNLAAHPGSPAIGQIYWNTTDDVAYAWDGTQWLNPFTDTIYSHPTFTAINPTLSGANVLASVTTNTEGHVTGATTRVLTLSDLGYTGDANANNYVHPNEGVDLGAALTGATVISDVNVNAKGHVTGFATRQITPGDLGAAVINDAGENTTQTWSSSKIASEILSAVTGGMKYVGGYNASTNTPNLDATPTGIKQGMTYTVTTAGTFFSTAVQVGDVIVAEKDDPTLEADWTVLNKNIPDIVPASTTAQGIIEIATQTEANTGTDNTRAITPSTMATYVANEISTSIGGTRYGATIGDAVATTFNITHGLGTEDVQVEVFDTTSKETVITDIDRIDINTVQVRVNAAPASNGLRVIIKH